MRAPGVCGEPGIPRIGVAKTFRPGGICFFILSGFLICRILRKPDFRYSNFLSKRATRIYFGWAEVSVHFAGAFVALFKDEELRQFCKRVPTHFVVGCYVFATTAWLYRAVDYSAYVGGCYLHVCCVGEAVLFSWTRPANVGPCGKVTTGLLLCRVLGVCCRQLSEWLDKFPAAHLTALYRRLRLFFS